MSKIEIEISDELRERLEREGMEVAAFRLPVKGEYYVDTTGGLVVSRYGNSYPSLIVRPKFDVKQWWPKWLTAAAVARDEEGGWFMYESKPSKDGFGWHARGVILGIPALTDLKPPPLDHLPWQETLLLNPWRDDLEVKQ